MGKSAPFATYIKRLGLTSEGDMGYMLWCHHPQIIAALRLLKRKHRVTWMEGSQILQSLSGSCMLGATNEEATSGPNYASMYCALEAQHSIVKMIKRLTFGSSMMDTFEIKALSRHEPRKMARQVATGISVALKMVNEVSYRV
jgi:hypothetical protein